MKRQAVLPDTSNVSRSITNEQDAGGLKLHIETYEFWYNNVTNEPAIWCSPTYFPGAPEEIAA